jgi:hypothetical protein
MASKWLVASLLTAGLTVSAVASAEPSAADRETARGLMTEGRTDRDKGDQKAALKAFLGADAIMHVPTTGLEVAKAQAALGLLVEARETAIRVTRIAEAPSDPAPFKAARDAAAAMSDDLAARIPSLTVTVKNAPEGTTPAVTIDDSAVPAEALGQPRKLNPGHHVVVAKAGGVDAKQEIDLAEKDKKDLAVELPAGGSSGAAAAATTGSATTAADTPATPPDEGTTKSGGSKALMIGGFGLAGAGVLVGAITGVLSMSKTSSIKSSPNCSGNVCGQAEDGDISSARSMATISTVSFIAAGAGAALGLVGLLTGNASAAAPSATPEKPPSDDSSPASTSRRAPSRVEPWIGLGAAGLRGTF